MDLESIILESMLDSYAGGIYESIANAMVGFTVGFGILGIFASIASIFFFVVSIAFTGAMLTRLSHKLNVFGKETLAYIPFVRDFYRMRMAGFHPALGLLINETGAALSYIVAGISFIIFKNFIIYIIILLACIVTNYFFTYKYYNKVLKLFGFEGTLALIYFIPGLSFILEVIAAILAFSDKFESRMIQSLASRVNTNEERVARLEKFHQRKEDPNPIPNPTAKAVIYGNRGKYGGSRFEIADGESITLGREARMCNIVYDDKYSGISRNHCAIRYSAAENCFYVTDNSSNGTFIGGTLKIGQGNTKKVDFGTVICLGDENNSFRLG